MTPASSFQIVHVRVNDAATGRPTPVRIRFEDSAGNYLPPLGHSGVPPSGCTHLAGGNLWADRACAYIDGTCEVRLPAGVLRVRISKGMEWETLDQMIERRLGQITLRLELHRQGDLAAQGWYAGDVQTHYLTPAAAALEGAAEGLHLVNLLIRDDRERGLPPDPLLADFSGQQPRTSHEACQVYVNTYHRGGTVGDLILLNCHRMVFPLRLEDEGFEKYTLMDWCNQCHRKGGLVVCPGLLAEPTGHLPALVLGGIDALMWSLEHPLDETALERWYRLLSCGFRIPLVGGSGKRDGGTPIGAVRTLARLPAGVPFSYRGWIEAVRGGRCYATSGPSLDFRVNDAGPGEFIPEASLSEGIAYRADVAGNAAGDVVEVVRCGEIVWTRDLRDGRASAAPPIARAANPPIWFAARVRRHGTIVAHTSPVYVDQAAKPPAALVRMLVEQLESDLDRYLSSPAAEPRCQQLRRTAADAKARLLAKIG